jgi:hypothetical protein
MVAPKPDDRRRSPTAPSCRAVVLQRRLGCRRRPSARVPASTPVNPIWSISSMTVRLATSSSPATGIASRCAAGRSGWLSSNSHWKQTV